MTTSDPSSSAPAAGVHLSAAERAERGKAARALVPRSAHAQYAPAADRPDPVGLLEEQARSRVPELVPIRYGRMLASPFAFFRGAAYVMASDLAGAPRATLRVQLSGDAHLGNFGVFAAPDRRLVFSGNDFDETLPGPFEWDVKRLVASFAVAARELGFASGGTGSASLAAARAYRTAMRSYARMLTVDVWYDRLEIDEIARQWSARVQTKRLDRIERTVVGKPKDSLRALAKLTELVDGERRFVSDPPLIVPLADLVSLESPEQAVQAARAIYQSYRRTLTRDRRHLLERYRFGDVARKVVGVGSVGMQSLVVLLLGRDDDDPLFLQIKEARASVLEPFLGKSGFANHGQRVVEGQRLTQAATDIMLGWIRADDVEGTGESRDYYVRQLWDGKASVSIDAMDAETLALYAELCGSTLARTHARSGDSVAIASYLGGNDVFDRALAAFGEAYADQTDRDYAALQAAAAAGRISVLAGI